MPDLSDVPAHLRNRLRVNTETGCWEWIGAKNSGGYGVQTVEGHLRRVHRLVYEALVGPFPPGLQPDHLCRNRACANPEHIEPVTRRENILRGESMSARHARQTRCHRGHPFTQENTYLRTRGENTERFCRECGRIRDRERYARKTSNARE